VLVAARARAVSKVLRAGTVVDGCVGRATSTPQPPSPDQIRVEGVEIEGDDLDWIVVLVSLTFVRP
jgi:hypothetical protein